MLHTAVWGCEHRAVQVETTKPTIVDADTGLGYYQMERR